MKPNDRWTGYCKVLEECGELTTVLGKLGPYPDGNHPDGKGDLIRRLEDEIADVIASTTYFAENNGLDLEYIKARLQMKKKTYAEWVLTGVPF
jgi:NTP pyrophosphatase (non-canonical NTP hydrolase)